MASYYDEHNCQELRDGEQPNHSLHLARLLLDSGLAVDLDLEFGRVFGREDERPPPASKDFIANLPDADYIPGSDKCAICLDVMEIEKNAMEKTTGQQQQESVDKKAKIPVKMMPCKHCFHSSCIIPWINHVSSCPLCKHDFPTDDESYEEFKRQKKRAKDREVMLEELHNSMFG